MITFTGNTYILILLSFYTCSCYSTRSAATLNYTGDAGCPCIDPWTSEITTATTNDANNFSSTCRTLVWNNTDDDIAGASETTSCVPMNYGASMCGAWEDKGGNNGDPRCDFSAETQKRLGICNYCKLNWCFVDVDNCNDDMEIAVSDIAAYPNLYQSYETCLAIESLKGDQVMAPLMNKMFRVGVPDDGVYDLYTQDDGTKNGSTVELFERIRLETNGTWEYVNVSEKSQKKYSSSYTACVHDIGLGLVDFCIGNFWPTRERFLINAPMTRSFTVDNFYLVSPIIRKDQVGYAEAFGIPFKVFTSEAWAGVILTGFYFAVVMYVIRITYAGGNYPGSSKCEAFVRGICCTSYDTIMYITSGDTSRVPNAESDKRPPEMVAIAGFAFFGVLTLTAYTASSAAAMVLPPYSGPMYQAHELEKITRNNHTICIPEPLRETFLSLYGHKVIEHEKVIGVSFGDIVNDYYGDPEESNCTTMILIGDMIKDEYAEGCLCNDHVSEIVLFKMDIVVPVSKDLVHAMSYAVQERVDNGESTQLANKYKSIVLGEQDCKSPDQCKGRKILKENTEEKFADEQSTYEEMDFTELITPIAISLLATSFSLIQFLLKRPFRASFSTPYHGKLRHDDSEQVLGDTELLQELLKLPASELLTRLEKANVSQAIIGKAINVLPDTTALIDLVFENYCSLVAKDILILHRLEVCELHDILLKSRPIDEESEMFICDEKDQDLNSNHFPTEEEINNAMNDIDKPKNKLIRLIMSYASVRSALSQHREHIRRRRIDSVNHKWKLLRKSNGSDYVAALQT